jgi:hypothetical protein
MQKNNYDYKFACQFIKQYLREHGCLWTNSQFESYHTNKNEIVLCSDYNKLPKYNRIVLSFILNHFNR